MICYISCLDLLVGFFDRLLQWLEQALRLAPPTNTAVGCARQAAAPSSTSGYPMLGEKEEQHVRALLQCVDAFFGGPYKKVKETAVAESPLVGCGSCTKRFRPLVRLTGRRLPYVTLRDLGTCEDQYQAGYARGT